MMLTGVGDVMSTCGANPCGFLDSLWASPECKTWQTCAAVANQQTTVPSINNQCVVGGLDANGNTIASCGGQDATESPYPVVTSAACSGMTPEQCAAITQQIAPTVGLPQWALLGGVVLLVVMIAGRR